MPSNRYSRPFSGWFPVMSLLLFCLFSAAGSEAFSGKDLEAFLRHAHGQIGTTLWYDPSYCRLPYPGGDVPIERGVCSDVIIRAFRAIHFDLQKEVHIDMKKDFRAYPKTWGLRKPDPNIDHRRVYNLMRFFSRNGWEIKTPGKSVPRQFLPGDIVSWRLDNGLPHIGIVSSVPGAVAGRLQVIHNIGAGACLEDVLEEWPVLGQYRWVKKSPQGVPP